ncbi:hypothetical protein MUP65_00535, partial [Patescibacteria group bacterium]|nr:hypothetical protein [Patescibacteria group bacterium]
MKKLVKNKDWLWFAAGAGLLLVLVYALFSWLGICYVCEEMFHLGDFVDSRFYTNPFWYSKAN